MTLHQEREIVVERRSRGSKLATILSLALILALVLVAWYFTLGPGGGGTAGGGTGGAGHQAVETPAGDHDAVESAEPSGS